MPDSAMRSAQLERWLSPLRFAPYLQRADGDPEVALELYEWNARLAAAALETIGMVEVLVRNAIHDQMKATTESNALHSWLLDKALLRPKERDAIQVTIDRLAKSGKPRTEDRVVAGMYISFWVHLLGGHYEELWRRRLNPAFPKAPDRNFLSAPMNRLMQLRNRTAHHDTVFDQAVGARLEDAVKVAGAIDPDAAAWVRTRSGVPSALAARPDHLAT